MTLTFQLILPTAFDEAGIRMLDSIHEIFDILDFKFQSVGFDFVRYQNFNEVTNAIDSGKCPVVDVLKKYLYSSEEDGSHVMVATGIQDQNGHKEIQLKNSFADNPNEQGKVLYSTVSVNHHIETIYLNFFEMLFTCNITEA